MTTLTVYEQEQVADLILLNLYIKNTVLCSSFIWRIKR